MRCNLYPVSGDEPEGKMNIIYDKKIKELLCPKCRGIAEWNDNADLECTESDCQYIYYMHSGKDNSFQMELFNEDRDTSFN